ncbi:MAG TPA: L-arabinose ABC transporter ATP-binding protein AraG [Pirellulales bacterium]
MPAANEYLQFDGISKHYPGVKALAEVRFGVGQGSVHALLGENGAGKSTLLKTLSGAHLPSAGTLRIGGNPVVFRSTAAAIEAGVAVIYQELHLIPQLSVAENLFLGHLPTRGGIVQSRKLWRQASEQLDRFGEQINPKSLLGKLAIGQRQMIEIAKALSRGAKIIAFDEPTSSLSARETRKLFEVIRALKQQGCAILYVTHRMDEVFAICDSATVLRDGKHVVTFDSLAGVSHDAIVKAMVGRELADIYDYRTRPVGEVALELENIAGPGLKAPVSLSVAQGEIVGIFGLVGAGRSELLKLIYGATAKLNGTVRVHGQSVGIRRPVDAIRAGVVLCPEDRKKEGIVPVASVQENINLSARRHTAIGKLIIRNRWERENARRRAAELAVKTPSLAQQIRFLSGGNQQKVILARWLSENIKVLLLDEPTRGIDVGARSEIYAIIYRLAEQGIGTVVVSSDLPEVLGVSDRVLVMREGQLAGDLPRTEATPERVMALALPLGAGVAAG